MVLLNTQSETSYNGLKVNYILDVPRLDCVFCSSRQQNGRAHLFLVFNDHGKIYTRQGLNRSWVEIISPLEYAQIRQLVTEARHNQDVPRYTASRNFSLS